MFGSVCIPGRWRTKKKTFFLNGSLFRIQEKTVEKVPLTKFDILYISRFIIFVLEANTRNNVRLNNF
jgi:hypothetical protein